MDRFRIPERTSRIIEFDLTDENGDPIAQASLTAAELTEFDLDIYVPGASPPVGIINGRNAQDVNNTNDVAIHATNGHVIWTSQPEDHTMPDDISDEQVRYLQRRQIWRHRAEFRFTTATMELHYECELEVTNLRKAS